MSDGMIEFLVLELFVVGFAGLLGIAGWITSHISPERMKRIEKRLFGIEH
jgi:hypothetical protein